MPLKPKIRFRNIGRETNPDLNRQFAPAEIKAFGHDLQDSKNLLVIDDTIDTGRTIADTDKLMQVSLPNATITYTTLETVIWDPNDHSRFKQRYTGLNDFQLKRATKKTFPDVPKNQLTPDQHTQAQEKYIQGFSSIGVGDLHDQKHLFRRDLNPLLDTIIKYLSPTPLNTLTLPTINPQTRIKLYKNNPNQFR